MIIHLATELEVPLRDRNTWLRAAGYADAYAHHGLDDKAMAQVSEVLQTMLDAHETFPAYVIDRMWNMVMSNTVSQKVVEMFIDPDSAELFKGNLLRLLMHPDGLKQYIPNWDVVAHTLITRFRREILEHNYPPR